MDKNNQIKKKKEFSKVLLIQEATLIWIMSISFILLAFYCIREGFTASLPWLSAMVGFPWSAYGVSQVYYYKKSSIENQKGGIKFETVLEEVKQQYNTNKISSSLFDDANGVYSYDNVSISDSNSDTIDLDYGI